MTIEKTYLGDGVYSEFDGYQIKLTTENGSQRPPTNTIYLEPEVATNLVRQISLSQWSKKGDSGMTKSVARLIKNLIAPCLDVPLQDELNELVRLHGLD